MPRCAWIQGLGCVPRSSLQYISLPTMKDHPFGTRIRADNDARARCEFRREKQSHIKIEEESYWTNGNCFVYLRELISELGDEVRVVGGCQNKTKK